jgi:hypothetical protein
LFYQFRQLHAWHAWLKQHLNNSFPSLQKYEIRKFETFKLFSTKVFCFSKKSFIFRNLFKVLKNA